MDFLVGIVGKDFVLVAADCSQARSVVIMKKDRDKAIQLSPHTVLLTAGDVGDQAAYGELMLCNIKLTALRNGVELTPWAQANFLRKQLADMLRSRDAKQVNVLFAGFDGTKGEHAGPQLYFMDYLASLAAVPYAAQGYGGFFTLSILDRHYKPDMSLEDAKSLLKRCIGEVQHRFIANMPTFITRVVDADGVRVIDL